jgi:hypothetical protein
MISNAMTVSTVARSANADIGQVAVTSPQTFRQILNNETNRVIRKNALLGELQITNSVSRELGVGSKRTLVRLNLSANGTALPAASAYVVITTAPGLGGPSRGLEAFGMLLSAILELAAIEAGDTTPDASSVPVDTGGVPQLQVGAADIYVGLSSLISRVLAGEG